MLANYLGACGVVAALALWLINRPLHLYDVRAGVRHNVELLTNRLDAAGITYEITFPVEGSPLIDAKELSGWGPALALRWRPIRAEVALALIKVRHELRVEEGTIALKKEAAIGGYSYPSPMIRLALTPKHCWGYDPLSLTNFNRDPKLGDVEYIKHPIHPRDLFSQRLPNHILDIAAEYLSARVAPNHYEIWHDAQ